MLVSVIIPSFGQPQFLERAISSCLEQDYFELEVIVVDDLSLDGSLAVAIDAMQRDPRVRVLARRHNGGLGRARNTGLASATGELVTFLDSDDYLLPHAISARVEVWNSLSDDEKATTTGIYGDWQHVGENDDHPVVRPPRKGLPVLNASSYAGENLFICSSPLLRPEPLREVGGFAEGVPMLEDYAAWARLIAAGGAFVPAEVVVCTYRQRPASMLRSNASVFMSLLSEINGWLADQGVGISSTRDPFAALEARADPKSARRINWFRAGSFGAQGVLGSARSQLLADADEPISRASTASVKGFMNRTADDLNGILDDVDEFAHTPTGPCRARLIQNKSPVPRVVFVPKTLEESLDAVALAASLQTVGCPSAIAVSNPRHSGENWPSTLTDVSRISPDTISDDVERITVFAGGGPLRQSVISRFPRTRIVVRTSGIDALNVYERGSARRYREGDTILVRSHLEGAELGDRPCSLLPSGVSLAAGLIWGVRKPNDEIVVLVPPALASSPWIHAWTQIALTTAQQVGAPVRFLASNDARGNINDLRPEPISVRVLRDAASVVTPLDGTASLIETLGGRGVVFDPIQDPDAVSAPWRRGASIATSVNDLAEALCGKNRGEPALQGLVSFEVATDIEALGHAALSAIFGGT